MSRDISMVSDQRDVIEGAIGTSLTKTPADFFDHWHKTMLSNSPNLHFAKPSMNEEEANTFCWKDFHGEVPSHFEAEEAAHGLQKSFMEKRCTRDDASATCHLQDLDVNMIEHVSQDRRRLQLENTGNNNAVAYCVDLLRHDPGLQAAIVSLASDPAVWDAFQRNEKIQELMQTRKMKQSQLDGTPFLQKQKFYGNPAIMALSCLRNLVWDTFGMSINLVGSVCSFVDRKIFGERCSDPLDKPFKACIVLTMLLFTLLLCKREHN